MAYRNSRRLREFYQSQVDRILVLLDREYTEGAVSLDAYLSICEQRGIEPDPENMPPEFSDYPHEVQVAFLISTMLPDKWDGMSGMNFGKDYSSLGTLLDIYDVPQVDRPMMMFFLKQIEVRKADSDNKESKRRQAADKRKGMAKGPKVRK